MCVSAGVTEGLVIILIVSPSVKTTPKIITPREMRQFKKNWNTSWVGLCFKN